MSIINSPECLVKMALGLLLLSVPDIALCQDNLSDRFSLSGLLKVDIIYDFGTPSGDRINYADITTSNTNDEKPVRIHARESRIGLKYRHPTNSNPLIAYIEGDFYGGGSNSPSGSENIANATSFALRHAYIKYGNWLVGQTWSNYVDLASFPETLDFSNDTGQAFLRQGQVRFQHQFNNLTLSYSIENPETDLIVSDEAFGNIDTASLVDPLFDFTTRVQYRANWGHLSAQAVIRTLEAYSGTTSRQKIGIGYGVSGKYQFSSNNQIKFHYSQGNGIGRYIQEVSGSAGIAFQSQQDISNQNFSIELLSAKGGYLAFQHRLSPTLRANLSAGFIDIDFSEYRNSTYLDDNTQEITSVHGNIIWTVYPSFELGIEHSIVKLTENSGAEGNIRRIQLSTKYRF